MKKKKLVSFAALLIFLFILAPGIFGQPTKLINLDFKNTDVKDVLRALANQSGVSLIVDDDTSGKVTIHLAKVTLAEALDVISKNYKLNCVKNKNVYYISPVDNSFLKVEFKEGFLTVEARDADIKTIYEQICQQSGINLVPSPDLKGKVSILINHSPLPDAIKILFTQTNCIGEQIGNNTYIRPKTTQPYNFTVLYERNLLTVDAKDIPLPVLARAITEKTGISIIPEQNLDDNTTIYFQDLPFDEGMEALCQANNFKYYKEAQSRRIARKNGAYRVIFKNSLLSIDADDVEITEIFSEISRQTSINIMLDRDISGKVTAHFQALPMFQGLLTLVENQGWYIEKQSNCYFVKKAGPENKDARIIYNPDTKLFNLDIRNGALAAVINEMAYKAGVNMVILNQVNWPVSNLRLRDLTFNQTLDYLLKGTVYTYKISNGVYMIGDGLLARPEVADFTDVKTYPIKYIKAEHLLNSLPPVFPRQDFLQLPNKNTLVLSAPASVHEQFSKYLAEVDVVGLKEQTEMIRIKNLKAEDVLKMIPSTIPKNNISLIKESNSLVINDIPSTIAQLKNYINTVDQVTPLIVFHITVLQLIGAQGVDFTGVDGSVLYDQGRRLAGIALNSGSFFQGRPGTSTGTNNTTASITALAKKNKIKLVANPTISTLAGYPASFDVSENKTVNIDATKDADGKVTSTSTKEFKSGLVFKITPWVAPNKTITMEIKPTITDFAETSSNNANSLPIVNNRSTETTIRVADNETFVISGLKKTRRTKNVSKVPLLGDIPLVGYLFRSHKNTTEDEEYIIVVTPSLVYNSEDKNKVEKHIEDRHNKDFSKDLELLLKGGVVEADDNQTKAKEKERAKAQSREQAKTKDKRRNKAETPAKLEQDPGAKPASLQIHKYRRNQLN